MTRDAEILQYLHYHPLAPRAEISEGITAEVSPATMRRALADAVAGGDVLLTSEAL